MMRTPTFLCFLLVCFISESSDLTLKDGLVLRDAVVKRVSGKNIIIVKHADGLGMYAYSAFSPDSAAVISNLFPDVARPLPLALPAPNADQQQVANNPDHITPQSASDPVTAAMFTNNKLFTAANNRLDSAIKSDRAFLSSQLEHAAERVKLEKEVNRLQNVVNNKEETLTDHNIYRGETRPFQRELRNSHDKLTWDQEHTLIYLNIRDKRKELEHAEASLKELLEGQERELHAFDVTANERQQKLKRIFDDFNRRIRMNGELITQETMEGAYK